MTNPRAEAMKEAAQSAELDVSREAQPSATDIEYMKLEPMAENNTVIAARVLPQINVRAADHGDLRHDLAAVLNRHSRENGSNTPDWILAQYLANCLDAYDVAIGARAQWYGRVDSIAGPMTVPRPKAVADDLNGQRSTQGEG